MSDIPEMVPSAVDRLAEHNKGAMVIEGEGAVFIQRPVAVAAVNEAFRDGALAERARIVETLNSDRAAEVLVETHCTHGQRGGLRSQAPSAGMVRALISSLADLIEGKAQQQP